VANVPLEWHSPEEKILIFRDMPDAQSGGFVDIMLIKYGHHKKA
jgi:hypothetical protein